MLNIDKLLNLLLGVDIWYAGNTHRVIPCRIHRIEIEKNPSPKLIGQDPIAARWRELRPVSKFYSIDGELLHFFGR